MEAWLRVMAPGAVIVVTTTASDASSNFAKAKQHVTDTYPAVTVSLGLTTEAVVAQRPDDDATPIVDMLRKAPFAVGAFLALFGEQIELQHLLQHEPEPSDAVRALIGRVIDQQHAERDAFLTALQGLQGGDGPPLGGGRRLEGRALGADRVGTPGSASTW